VFDDAYVHEALRRVEANVPGELRFADDGTVDYVATRGSDKTGSVTLSPDSATVDGPLPIVDDGQSDELDATHLRVMGGHEGEARPRVNLVPQDDPDTYPAEVRYSTPLWSSDDDTEWGRWTNPDLTSQETVVAEAESLAEEIVDPVIEVKTGGGNKQGVRGVDLALGDRVTVRKPDAGLDRAMRVHRVETRVTDGVQRDAVELSTRTYARDTDRQRARNVHRDQVGFQGASVYNTVGPVEQNVDAGEALELEFYYPPIAFENVVDLNINSLPYRYYVSPADHDHGFSVPDHDHDFQVATSETSDAVPASDETEVFAANGTETNVSFDNDGTVLYSDTIDGATTGDPIEGWPYYIVGSAAIDSGESDAFRQTSLFVNFPNLPGRSEYNLTTTTETPSKTYTRVDGSGIVTRDVAGDTIELRLKASYPNATTQDITWGFRIYAIDPHTHNTDVIQSSTTSDGGATSSTTNTQAGVNIGVESTSATASNVDVVVNGSTVATGIGGGVFDETIDLRGELQRDAKNRVEVISDSPGRFFAGVDIDAYRKVGSGQ